MSAKYGSAAPVIALWAVMLAAFCAPVWAKDFVFSPAIVVSNPQSLPLIDIVRTGDRLVAAGERGLIIVSDDDGQTWRQAEVPVSATLTALSFSAPRIGWAVGHAGVILHTDDGGNSWQRQFDGRDANRLYLDFTKKQLKHLQGQLNALSQSAPEASGQSADPALSELQYQLEDAIFAVEDAESALENGPADPFLDVLALSVDSAIAVGAYGMIYRTDNGGKTWQLGAAGIENIDRFHYYAIAQSGDGILYLSGEAGLLYRSTDGGNNWERLEELYDGSLFGLVVKGKRVLAFGLRGNIFLSKDNGYTWAQWENPSEYSLYGGSLLADGAVVLLGSGGLVLLADAETGALKAFNDPTRTTFSAAVRGRGAELIVVGMNGVRHIDTGKGQSDE